MTIKKLKEFTQSYFFRLLRLFLGLFLYALGTVITIQANVGLAPWEAFHMGLSQKTGISFGRIVILVGLIIIIVSLFLKEKIGFGTILNMIFIGIFCDLIIGWNIIPKIDNYALGILFMLFGLFVISIGSYFYIGSALGAGPRDSLMIGLKKKFSHIPVGMIRGMIEGTVLLLGWLMGAKVGFGTVIAVFGISFILQFTFKCLRFNVDDLHSESVTETFHNLGVIRKES